MPAPDYRPFSRLPELSAPTRWLLLFAGWLLVLVGIAGLVLPGIQGILTLMLGAAFLSLVSPWTFRLLRRMFRPWPRGWKILLRLRRKILRRVSPRRAGKGDP
ncbi:MAG: PGPGW domain-containing protein [Holophagales bacterium]|nr:PGPGW domain-containing protein [Holophagales bacterium]